MKTPKLLPCPFCGKEPIITNLHRLNHAGEMIECLTDGCVGPHVSYYGQNTARKKWNMRVCEKCGGLQGTDNFEMIAGTPCSCVPNSDARQGMVPAELLSEALGLMDTPEHCQDDDWQNRRNAIAQYLKENTK